MSYSRKKRAAGILLLVAVLGIITLQVMSAPAIPFMTSIVSERNYSFLLSSIDEVNLYATHVFVGKVTEAVPCSVIETEYTTEVTAWIKGEMDSSTIHVKTLDGTLQIGKTYILATEYFQLAYAPHPSFIVLYPEFTVIEVSSNGVLRGDKSYLAEFSSYETIVEYMIDSPSSRNLDERRPVAEVEDFFPAEKIVELAIGEKNIFGKQTLMGFYENDAQYENLLMLQYNAADCFIYARVTSLSPITKYLAEGKVHVLDTLKGEWPKEYIFWVPHDLVVGKDYLFFTAQSKPGTLIKLAYSNGSYFCDEDYMWERVSSILLK